MSFIIEYAKEIAITILTSGFLYLMKKFKESYKSLNGVRNGVEVLLKTRIIQEYYYHKRRRCMTVYEKEAMNELYNEYKKLDNSDLIDKLIKELDELPIINCEEGEK